MKKLFFSVIVLMISATIFGQKKADDIARFDNATIDQGKLKQNNPEEVKFVVTNISNAPLIIEQATPTCGCTIGDYTKTPIPPGGKGFVSAKFNAANLGHFEKHLTVKFAGADDIKSITISGEVLNAEDYDKWKGLTAAPVTQPGASKINAANPGTKNAAVTGGPVPANVVKTVDNKTAPIAGKAVKINGELKAVKADVQKTPAASNKINNNGVINKSPVSKADSLSKQKTTGNELAVISKPFKVKKHHYYHKHKRHYRHKKRINTVKKVEKPVAAQK